MGSREHKRNVVMIKKIPTPDRPHFIFGSKLWEIEDNSKKWAGRISTEVTFESILEHPGITFDSKPIINKETVVVRIDDSFIEPEISIYQKNGDTIEPLSLPFYVIKKLVKEAEKIDMINRIEKK